MHDVLAVSITVATILVASFLNQSALNSLRSDLNSKIDLNQRDLNSKMDAVQRDLATIQRDMREFYAEQARHDVRLTAVERASSQS